MLIPTKPGTYKIGPVSYACFDPKTGDTKGPGNPISTKAGFQLTEYLPETAKIADKITVIRSMSAKVGVHAQAHEVALEPR